MQYGSIAKSAVERVRLKMIKVAYLSFPRYLSLPILSSIAKEIKKIGVNFYIDTNEEEPNGVAVPDNFDMTVRINKKLVTDALSDVSGHRVFKLIKSVRDLKNHVNSRMDFLNPDAIVATSDMGGLVTRLCNEWAVKHNRPFFVMQPSFLEVAPEKWKERISRILIYVAYNKILRTPIGRKQHKYGCERKTNYLLLWGIDFANQIKDIAIARNTFMVGNPLLDKFASKKVKIDVNNPTALICTQPYDKLVDMGILKSHQASEMHSMLFNIVNQNPNVHFIVRVHPSENPNKYAYVLYNKNANCTIEYNTRSMHEALEHVDVQISMASYTSFEAVVAGVPIIIIHPEFVDFFNQFYGIGCSADSVCKLNAYLSFLMQPYSRELFTVERKNYLNKKLSYFGNSAEITANTIKKVIDWKKPGFR
jgi:UDP-N-acetylglucosamine:LPS N-acetylglucosamine transferase